MSNLKQLRSRIKSIKSTKKITKAMQMVSAAKLRKAKNALESAVSYYDAVKSSVAKAVASHEDLSPLAKSMIDGNASNTSNKPSLIVIYSADRGLCGGFNQNIIRLLKSNILQDNDVKIIAIGKRVVDFIDTYYPEYLVAEYTNAEMTDEKILELTDTILSMLIDNSISTCELYFNHFKNVITQSALQKRIVPFELEETDERSELVGEEILNKLLRLYLVSELKNAFLHSKASEEAARATAMDNATRNAGDLINSLTLIMNRQRQAAITTELIEIISGASAV